MVQTELTIEAAEAQRCEQQLHELLFGVRRSIRYHNHRRRFFDGFDKFVKILSLLGGSAAVITAIGSNHGLTIAFAAIVAFFSAINLAVGPAQAGTAARRAS